MAKPAQLALGLQLTTKTCVLHITNGIRGGLGRPMFAAFSESLIGDGAGSRLKLVSSESAL